MQPKKPSIYNHIDYKIARAETGTEKEIRSSAVKKLSKKPASRARLRLRASIVLFLSFRFAASAG